MNIFTYMFGMLIFPLITHDHNNIFFIVFVNPFLSLFVFFICFPPIFFSLLLFLGNFSFLFNIFWCTCCHLWFYRHHFVLCFGVFLHSRHYVQNHCFVVLMSLCVKYVNWILSTIVVIDLVLRIEPCYQFVFILFWLLFAIVVIDLAF